MNAVKHIIKSAGSNRVYRREEERSRTVIRVEGTSRTENRAFITMARHFHQLGLPVPEVYWVSEDEMSYTQEDLGDILLFDYIAPGRTSGEYSEKEKDMLGQVMRALAHIQVEGAKGLNWEVCYPVPSFDRRSVFWDLNYFKYDFLKLRGVEIDEVALEADFERLANRLLAAPCDVFMYRDCQSRNVMIKDSKPYFIDFQGGRKGPIYYDLASFLWQAKANYPQALREELLEVYLDELSAIGYNVPLDSFRETLKHFVLFRTLQVLGAYGLRGLHEGKQHFVESIPLALNNLREVLNKTEDYPYLKSIEKLCRQEKPELTKTSELTVTVYSFSYKKGIPADTSGNGGGYVFDCRSTHNPGKYDEYKPLTGKDKAVIDFLEKDGEILDFLTQVYALVDHHVERFIERGFTHLQVAFGCTGGQHRSVYCAEAMAKHLREKYGVTVELIHREQPTI
ncbi:MAG: phosphotransferase [Paludibacteraceae bacterium]|nr:phosphotransferase [Paludibacteraceae bacterium]